MLLTMTLTLEPEGGESLAHLGPGLKGFGLRLQEAIRESLQCGRCAATPVILTESWLMSRI